VVPPLVAGWSTRRKSHHFHVYDRVAEDFAKLIGIDPWAVNPAFSQCGKVNFSEKEGEECLAANVEFVLGEIREKYAQYGITEQPFVIVKADAGTYGMGIMTVKSVDDVRNLNRKTRNKMSTIKDSQPVHEVIIQEGVYTLREPRRRGRRARGLHGRPVRGRRLLPRAHRARHRREPELARRAVQAARLRDRLPVARLQRQARRPPNRFYTYGVIARWRCSPPRSEVSELVERDDALEVEGGATHEARVRRRSPRATSRPTRIRASR
jgi:glutamate--cysteine ligase